MLSRLVHPSNASPSIVSNPEGRLIFVNPVHLENASALRVVMLDDTYTLVIPVQSE